MNVKKDNKTLTNAQLWCLGHLPFTPEDNQPMTQQRALELLEANKIALYQGVISQAEFDSACEELAQEFNNANV